MICGCVGVKDICHHRGKFEDLQGQVEIPEDGTPFIITGTEVRECHHEPVRKKPKGVCIIYEMTDCSCNTSVLTDCSCNTSVILWKHSRAWQYWLLTLPVQWMSTIVRHRIVIMRLIVAVTLRKYYCMDILMRQHYVRLLSTEVVINLCIFGWLCVLTSSNQFKCVGEHSCYVQDIKSINAIKTAYEQYHEIALQYLQFYFKVMHSAKLHAL